MRLVKEIMKLLLGYKYRAVILKDRGVERYWICSYIFEDTPEGNARLKKYLNTIEATVTAHTYYETVTFRSRRWYAGQVRMEKVKPIPHTDGRKSCPEMFREVRIKNEE
jgi:hypothetical protein